MYTKKILEGVKMEIENTVQNNENVQNNEAKLNEASPKQLEMIDSFNQDQLTYVCEYCGKVSPIADGKCGRCGKRRPRNAYMEAVERANKVRQQREQQIQAQAQQEAQASQNFEQQVARIVEDRVADEKVVMQQQMDALRTQDIEDVKRFTARDAVQRIIAVENAADERVRKAQQEAEDLKKKQSKENEALIQSEREKIIYEAAQRMVSERAGIENAADERIANERTQIQHDAIQTIEEANAEAARKAALKVIAAEQANNDKLTLERLAMQRAVIDRIEDERRATRAEAEAIFYAEKKGMEEAATARIEAERRRLYKYGGQFDGYQQPMMQQPIMQQPYNYQQPITIVPYVNPNQPVYQYQPTSKVYRFVPDEPVLEEQAPVQQKDKFGFGDFNTETPVETPAQEVPSEPQSLGEKPKKKKKLKVRKNSVLILMIIGMLAGIFGIIASVVYGPTFFNVTPNFKNIEIISGIFSYKSNPFSIQYGSNAMASVASVFGLIMAAGFGLCAFSCGIDMFKRRCTLLNLIFSILGLVGAIGFIILSYVTTKEISIYGTIIIGAAALLMFAMVLISFIIRKKNEKKLRA